MEELVKRGNSNILPKPNVPDKPPVFQSFFTKVIILLKETEAMKKSLGSLSNQIDEDEEENNKITLDKFYIAMGNSFNFNYKNFDFTTLKKLLKFILCVSSSQQHDKDCKEFDKGIRN